MTSLTKLTFTEGNENAEYYVYVYIDPRNFEEFYYGKGKNNRKEAHLAADDEDSAKAKIIKEIKKEGSLPIIKVIANGLTEDQALLVEKTLIWKLGRTLANKSSGHFADKFRPHNTFHKSLPGFDFKNGIYHINIGEGPHRCWEDCKKYNFFSAGQDMKYSNPLKALETGDMIAAYVNKYGYVGIGKVKAKAIRIDDFRYKGKSLNDLPLKVRNIFENHDNDKSEYIVKVEWLSSVDTLKDAKWKTGLGALRGVKVSLNDQRKWIEFLEQEFNIKFADYREAIFSPEIKG